MQSRQLAVNTLQQLGWYYDRVNDPLAVFHVKMFAVLNMNSSLAISGWSCWKTSCKNTTAISLVYDRVNDPLIVFHMKMFEIH